MLRFIWIVSVDLHSGKETEVLIRVDDIRTVQKLEYPARNVKTLIVSKEGDDYYTTFDIATLMQHLNA